MKTDYKNLINPELRKIAVNIPYHEAIIKCANIFQTISFRATPIPDGVANRTITIKGHKNLKFKTEIFEPSNIKQKLPCLIYIHGGAFSYKAAAYHKKLACIYALKAKCRVYFPDYHLTPEYPYPAAYDDVLALYQCVMKNAEKWKIDSEKIALAGDSAGASLAALIANNYEREDLKPPCMQMLVYPLTDITMRTDSMKKFPDTPLWNAKNNRRALLYYCGHLRGEHIYDASPMQSDLPEIIPDTYIETAEFDCLHDEGVLYGQKLQNAGAKVEINETTGTIHGYDCAINTQIAAENIRKRVLFLKKGFWKGSPKHDKNTDR